MGYRYMGRADWDPAQVDLGPEEPPPAKYRPSAEFVPCKYTYDSGRNCGTRPRPGEDFCHYHR